MPFVVGLYIPQLLCPGQVKPIFVCYISSRLNRALQARCSGSTTHSLSPLSHIFAAFHACFMIRIKETILYDLVARKVNCDYIGKTGKLTEEEAL